MSTTETTTSHATALLPIVGMLKAAANMHDAAIDPPTNARQAAFVATSYDPLAPLVDDLPELTLFASHSTSEVNEFLAERNFTIALEPWDPAEGFGAVGILDVRVEWLTEGEIGSIRTDAATYPAVTLSDGLAFSSSSAGTLVRITTKSGDIVSLFMAETAPSGEELVPFVQSVIASAAPGDEYGELVLPMISYDRETKLDWLQKLRFIPPVGRPYFLDEALQQTRFRLNPFGARAESAAAGHFAYESFVEKTRFTIDRPFVLSIERPGFPAPLFSAHLAQDAWKDPGSLD